MRLRTARLKQLVGEALGELPAPHSPDVIDEVFQVIETNPVRRKTYDEIVYALGKPATHAWAAFWIAHAEGGTGGEVTPASRSTLIESYSRLVPAAKRGKKVKEPAAVKAMHEHFLAHRDALPANIRDMRETIVTLIMEGISVEDAFAYALEKPTLAR
jgi:predicted nucleic acid-binding protein